MKINNKDTDRKKLIALLMIFLSLSNIISTAAFAQQTTSSVSDFLSVGFVKDGKLLKADKSESCSIGFGKNGTILLPTKSDLISVAVNSPVPLITTSDPLSLPPIEGKREISINGTGFTQNSSFYLVKPDQSLTPVNKNFLRSSEVNLNLDVTNLDIPNQKITFQAINKNFRGNDFKSNLFELPLNYSAPLLTDKAGISLVSITPVIGVVPQIVTFNAKDVINPDDIYLQNQSDLKYTWNFGESGDTENPKNPNISTNSFATHTYEKPGKYNIILIAENSHGKISTLTKEIEIREKNFAPEGTFSVDKITGDIPLVVNFNSKVTDTENDEITYRWDFGDGQNSTEKNPNHTYTIPGKYQPKLTVSDILGAKTTITSGILTLLPPNNLPSVQLATIPQESTLKINNEGLFTSEVQLISSGTFDPDSEELIYEWDFGDGSVSSELNPKHEYKNSGEYTVRLSVTDSRGGKTTKDLKVKVSKPNPIASVKLDQTTSTAPFEVSFDGSSSQDYDAKPVSLKWDFGDNTSQTVSSTEGTLKHTYEDPGVYLVTLTAITSDNRFTKINPGNIIVGPGNAPIGKITVIEGDPNGTLGKAKVKLSAAGSYDPLDTQNPLKYKWSWSTRTWDINGNLADISDAVNEQLVTGNDGETFEYTFTKAGQFTPILEIEKSDGSKSNFYGETFTITPDQAPIAVAKILSEKTEEIPGLEVSFDGSESYDPKAGGGLKILTWDFGDGEKSTEISPKHIYNKEGTFTPTLVLVDNENNVGFAQAASIKIFSHVNSQESKEIASRVLFQTEETEEEIQSSIDSMIKEALDSFVSNDNKKPEIGPISIEPKTVSPGGVIKLNCFVRDNIGLSNFGYTLTDLNNNIISQRLIDLLNKNNDSIIRDEYFIDENIQIPNDITPGNYKIKLTATDTTGNQIAKGSPATSSTNEEIVINFEVLNGNTGITPASSDIIVLPDKTSIITAERLRELESKTTAKKDFSNALIHEKSDLNKFFIRSANISQNDNVKIKNITKLQTAGFDVTGLSTGINPWYPAMASSSNSLQLKVVSEKDGAIEIGSTGSLNETQYNKWYKTNVYVDSKYIGKIEWWNSAIISFNSNTTTKTIRVEFRPADYLGNDLPSGTWISNNFIFTKIIQPQITSIFPQENTAGRGAFDLRVNGNNFTNTSKVYFDGYLLTPYAISPTTLYVRIPAYLVSYIGFKTVSILNSDGSQSNIQYYTAKANQNNPCNINKTLPQTYWGADAQTVLSGNNAYISSPYAVIEGNGSVSIPFCLDNAYDIKTSLNLSHYKSGSSGSNYIDFWIDGVFVKRTFVDGNQDLHWDNLDTRTLSDSLHELKISFNGGISDSLFVKDITFSNGGGPRLDSISPSSVSLEGTNRKLTVYGNGFDQNTIVLLDNQIISKASVTNNQITVNLPDTFTSPGGKSVQLSGNGKSSTILQLSVRDRLELINGSFKITPTQPFPGNNFDVELKTNNQSSESGAEYTAHIGIFDPDGKLLLIPNTSTLETIVLNGFKNPAGEISFNGSVPLSLTSKPGNYTVISYVKRNVGGIEDYSSIEAAKYIGAKALGINYSDALVPASHRLIFTPKPAVGIVFGIEENGSENAGFVQSGNKVIQDGQGIKFKVQISTGTEYSSKLRYNFISGDGHESGLTSNDNYTFTYRNTNPSSTTPLTENPKLEIFWAENGQETKIGTSNGPTIFTYPNYNPIAKARVSGDTYATTPPLFTTFTDTDSYDPNQRFSSAIDFVNPKQNDWKLFQLKFNQDSQLVSLPIDGKVSEDGKTFYSGNLYTPGSYFAKLTVKDQTGLTDTASTESVTLTKPSQMVIVFATTDPSDKKVYDPSSVIPAEAGIQKAGIPVKFKSDVKTLGGNVLSQSYKWDFGDGSCHSRESGNPDEGSNDCISQNPTHYYYDGKRSFNGRAFVDRKSVTPKLTVTTVFKNGHKETWESSAGTITFNADPNFLLLDVKPDQTSGTAPFTVNLMIDSTSAKAVNATVIKYELDWNDNVIPAEAGIQERGSLESGEITFNQLVSKIFTHSYTSPGSYSPKLTV